MLAIKTPLNQSGPVPISLRCRAFTCLEFLVVVAVLAGLAAILLPALARSKQKALRVVCLNNEKQLYTSLQIYCAENGDKLPLAGFAAWAWDMPASTSAAMLNSGCTKKTFYCPSTAPRFTDNEDWQNANSLWNYGNPNYSMTGYSFAMGAVTLDPQYQNQRILAELHTNSSPFQIFTDNPATRELIPDVILSTGETVPVTGTDNFTAIYGGFTQNGYAYPHLSAHVERGLFPAGGNIAYKDGHARWKKFHPIPPGKSAGIDDTKARTGNNSPYFWW
jgi:type II secretory pathway pseudopilin PulG